MPAAASNCRLIAAGRRRASRANFPTVLSRAARRRLRNEATDLAQETFDRDVTPCRLIQIEARMLQIEAQLEARP